MVNVTTGSARRLCYAIGETHTVREFAELAFKHTGIDIEWKGKGIDEIE